MKQHSLKVLYFGFYNPSYPRNRVLIKGLRQNGVMVTECNERSGSILRYLKILFKYLKIKPKYDVMVVGFPGQEAMFLARFLTRKPIIFDAFTSHYGGYILDRKYYPKKSLRAQYYRFVDKWSCKLADLILLDTQAHIDFFVREFSLPVDKFRRIFVGTDSDVFKPRNVSGREASFLVHFHGYFIPLQGVRYIVKAAKLLERKGIIFNLIGRGQTYDADRRLAHELEVRNINFIDKVSYEDLSGYIARADVCLGIFGDTPKTELVIPNKVYEALASRKAVITSDTKASRELLEDGNNALFTKAADSRDIAEKIIKLKDDPVLRDRIAENGYRLFKENLMEIKLAQNLIEYINEKISLRR